VIDPTDLRTRYLVGIFIAAIVTAAVLRHVVHTYGGFSREEIRTVSLVAVVAIFLIVLFVVRRRRRR
jgi:membrane-bound acyltransferase YfiQ involved in biofilm formation